MQILHMQFPNSDGKGLEALFNTLTSHHTKQEFLTEAGLLKAESPSFFLSFFNQVKTMAV